MKTIALILILLGAIPVAYSETLCTADEAVLFSCNTRTNRIVSLCGSKGLTESTGYIQYRYGRPAKIELVYPSAKVPPKGKFTKDFRDWPRGGYESSLSFVIGHYTYTVYSDFMMGSTEAVNEDTSGTYGPHAGVRVETDDGRRGADIPCVQDDVLDNDPRVLDGNLPEFLK